MRLPTPYSLLLVLSVFLLYVQCKQDNFSSIESQKEELLDDFLELSLNNNPLFDLYDNNELTILEAEKIIQELNQGKELKTILPAYLSDEVDVKQVYDFFYQTARLTQGLRRYSFTKEEVNRKIEHYPIRTRQKKELKDVKRTRSTLGRIEYNRCVRYAEQDYEDCTDQAVRSGFTGWGITVVTVGFGGAIQTGGLSIFGSVFLLGPIVGVMTYGNAKNYCQGTLEKEIIRCEEKWL